MTGPAGPPDPRGLPGPSNGGLLYTRWGRTSCPNVSGAELVYQGRAGKANNNQVAGVDHQCMPNDPEYATFRVGVQGYSYMYGVGYDKPILSGVRHDDNVPRAVCYVPNRGVVMMIPAKHTCPTSWTKEYSGFLMSACRGHTGSATFECVDSHPEIIDDNRATGGGLLCHVEAFCNGLECPPYIPEKELTCVVCTK